MGAYLCRACHLQRRRAEVLTRMLGTDDFGARVTIPAGKTVPGSGPGPTTAITIGLTKWSEMAIDSGNSRNWAGIHFVDANRHGVEVGRKVGRNALDKASSYLSYPLSAPRRQVSAPQPLPRGRGALTANDRVPRLGSGASRRRPRG